MLQAENSLETVVELFSIFHAIDFARGYLGNFFNGIYTKDLL